MERNAYIHILDCYKYDVEEFIQGLQRRYDFNFTTLPCWRELVHLLYHRKCETKRMIENAQINKMCIIKKLYKEICKERGETCKKLKLKKPKEDISTIILANDDRHRGTEIGEEGESLNSVESSDITTIISSPSKTVQVQPNENVKEPMIDKIEDSLSDIMELYGLLRKHITPKNKDNYKNNADYGEKYDYEPMKLSSAVHAIPKEIRISKNKEHCISFTLTNIVTTELAFVQFSRITNFSPFQDFQVSPKTVIIVYPGMQAKFKLLFKLKQEDSFVSEMCFKVGHRNKRDGPVVFPQDFFIPIVASFDKNSNNVTVSKSVYIPPLFSWQIKRDGNYPVGFVEVIGNDDNCYHLHISKMAVSERISSEIPHKSLEKDVNEVLSGSSETNRSSTFIDVLEKSNLPKSESCRQAPIINVLETSNLPTKNPKYKSFANDIIDNTSDLVEPLANKYIIDLSLDTFIFDKTYVFVKPGVKNRIKVYFTKIENIGSHNCYYNFEFYDQNTYELCFTKRSRIFADIFPHPIQIDPSLLDMSQTPVVNGYCVDKFVIKNTHNAYSVDTKIMLSPKMKKLFTITPMLSRVCPKSSLNVFVRFCKSAKNHSFSKLSAHFVVKIILKGSDCIYKDVPPIYYEMIMPRGKELIQVYNLKDFSRESLSDDLKDCTETEEVNIEG